MEAVLVDTNNLVQKKHRRSFTEAQKLAILDELEEPAVSVSALARKHGITSSLVFSWRRKYSTKSDDHGDMVSNEPDSELIEYKKMLAAVKEQEGLLAVVSERVRAEALSGQGSTYNMANSVSSITAALCKLQERKAHLIEKIAIMEAAATEVSKDEEIPFEMEREAERMCFELVKERVAQKKAAAAKAMAAS